MDDRRGASLVSVLDPETARAAILAGADFIVAPTLNLDTVALCKRYSIPVMPGCNTPTEALTAWESGADMVKLFPASFGGPALVKAILAPLPHLEIVPVGGVKFEYGGRLHKCRVRCPRCWQQSCQPEAIGF